MDVETAIAAATLDRAAFRDPMRRDNPMTVTELGALAPGIDFRAFFRDTGDLGAARVGRSGASLGDPDRRRGCAAAAFLERRHEGFHWVLAWLVGRPGGVGVDRPGRSEAEDAGG